MSVTFRSVLWAAASLCCAFAHAQPSYQPAVQIDPGFPSAGARLQGSVLEVEPTRSPRMQPASMSAPQPLSSGQPNYGFTLGAPSSRGPAGWVDSVAAGDLTGDGRTDVVVATTDGCCESAARQVFLYAQDEGGHLTQPEQFDYGQAAKITALVVLDIDGRFGDDLVVGGEDGLTVMLASQAGSLDVLPVHAGETVTALDVLDFNRDGADDLVAVGAGTVELHANQGDGTFESDVLPTAGLALDIVATGDLDADGDSDLALVVQRFEGMAVQVYWNEVLGLVEGPYFIGAESEWVQEGLGIGDVDNDGFADLVYSTNCAALDPCLKIIPTLGEKQFGPVRVLPAFGNPDTLIISDLDNDGRKDIVVDHTSTQAVSIYRQGADGVLGSPILYWATGAAASNVRHSMDVGDINADGCADVVFGELNYGLTTMLGYRCGGIFHSGFD